MNFSTETRDKLIYLTVPVVTNYLLDRGYKVLRNYVFEKDGNTIILSSHITNFGYFERLKAALEKISYIEDAPPEVLIDDIINSIPKRTAVYEYARLDQSAKGFWVFTKQDTIIQYGESMFDVLNIVGAEGWKFIYSQNNIIVLMRKTKDLTK